MGRPIIRSPTGVWIYFPPPTKILNPRTHGHAPMNDRTRARTAVLVLSFCCVCWGFSFPVMQIGAAALDRTLAATRGAGAPIPNLATRATFNGWRFLIAGVISAALAGRQIRRTRRAEITGGAVIGTLFGSGMLFQLYGLQYTPPSVSGFLTAMSVVFAPIAQAAIFKRPVGSRVWVAVAVATLGMVVLSAAGADAHAALALAPPVPFLGEILTVLGSAIFTAQILGVDHLARDARAAPLTAVLLLTAGAINTVIGLSTGGASIYRAAVLGTLARDLGFVAPMAGLVLISSVLALQLMNAWQPRIPPATATVVYCLEPVFGTAFSVAFRTESLTPATVLGGAVIVAAVLTVARGPRTSAAAAAAAAPIPGFPIE